MLNIGDVVKENKEKHNINLPKILDHPYSI